MRASIPVSGLAATALASLLLTAPAIAGGVSRGEILSAPCAGCHGTDGRSPGAMPDISGKSAEFIRTSLLQFKSGERPSTVMGRQAKGYSDEEIQRIAEYFGQRK